MRSASVSISARLRAVFSEMIDAARFSERRARASTTRQATPVAASATTRKSGAPVSRATPASARIAKMVAKDSTRGVRLGISGASGGAATRRRADASGFRAGGIDLGGQSCVLPGIRDHPEFLADTD